MPPVPPPLNPASVHSPLFVAVLRVTAEEGNVNELADILFEFMICRRAFIGLSTDLCIAKATRHHL